MSKNSQLQNTKTKAKRVNKTNKTKNNEDSKQKTHPIAEAITTFVHGIRDIEVAASVHVKLAVERKKEKIDNFAKTISEQKQILNDKSSSPHIAEIIEVLNATDKIINLVESRVPQMLELSLFLGLFSVYDNFTGDLLTAIYLKKPELFNKFNRTILLSEILQHDSFDELKSSVLQQEIEDFRRKSYVDQFDELERNFDIKLKAFDKWSEFVECGQRRNLLTHCGGIISKQYLKVCNKEKVSFSSEPKLGDKLVIGPKYFILSCELLMEVGFKLGQTLWRKIFPTELEEIDSHLISIIFEDCLRTENWRRGQKFGEFAIGLNNLASDSNRKICIINYAIALKFDGKAKEAKEVLSKVDWSSTSNDFKIAEAVLSNNIKGACELMKRIGKKGDLISEEAYHLFPLFKEFRQTRPFLKTYEEIYGRPFAKEVQKAADSQIRELEKQKSEQLKLTK